MVSVIIEHTDHEHKLDQSKLYNKFYTSETNSSKVENRVLGLTEAFADQIKRSKYILWTKDYIQIHPDEIDEMVAAANKNVDEISLVYGDFLYVNSDATTFAKYQLSFDRQRLMSNHYIEGPLLLNVEALKSLEYVLDPNMSCLLEYDLIIRITQNSMGIRIPEFLSIVALNSINKDRQPAPHLLQKDINILQQKFAPK